MKKVLFIILCHFLSITVLAQSDASIVKADNASMNSFSKEEQLQRVLDQRSARNVQSFDTRYEGVKGSPYVLDDWAEGSLVLKDSARVNDQLLYKFDATKNELWIKLPNGQQRILYNKELLSFELFSAQGKHLIFKKVKLPESVDKNYFAQILYEGNHITLVKDIKKVFRKSNLEDKGLVTVGNPYDWFEEIATYYIKVGNHSLEKIKMKRSDFIEKASSKDVKNIEKYCKDNNISGKMADEEAVKLVKYMDSLKEDGTIKQ